MLLPFVPVMPMTRSGPDVLEPQPEPADHGHAAPRSSTRDLRR